MFNRMLATHVYVEHPLGRPGYTLNGGYDIALQVRLSYIYFVFIDITYINELARIRKNTHHSLAPTNLWTAMNRLRTLWPLLATMTCCSDIRVVREGGRKRRRKRRRRWLFAQSHRPRENPTKLDKREHTHNNNNKTRESQSSRLYSFKLAVASSHLLLPQRR